MQECLIDNNMLAIKKWRYILSFLLGICFGHVGILLADKRLNMSFKDGSNGVNDDRPVMLDLNNGKSLNWCEDFRKITKIKNGFAASAGEAITGRVILDSFNINYLENELNPSKIIALASSEVRSIVLNKVGIKEDEINKTSVMLLEDVQGKISLCSFDCSGNKNVKQAGYVAYWPPELSDSLKIRLISEIENIPFPSTFEILYSNISIMANIANEVFKGGTSVSPNIEFGICTVNGTNVHYAYGKGDSVFLSKANTSDINQCITQIQG